MKRVLYIEDEPALRRVVQRMAARSGFDVDVAADGDEARHFVATHRYSILISDYMLGEGLLGTDLLAEIAPQQPGAGLIMVSAFVADDHLVEIDGRRVHMVSKPWTQQSLLATLEDAFANGNSGEIAE